MKRVRADVMKEEPSSPICPRRIGSTPCAPQEGFLYPSEKSSLDNVARKDDTIWWGGALPMMPDDIDSPIENRHGTTALLWIHRVCNVLESPSADYIPVGDFASGSSPFYDTTTHGNTDVALPLLPSTTSSSCGTSQRLTLRLSSGCYCVRG
jgi:hypothetical protein